MTSSCNIVTGDENLFHRFDPEMKLQNMGYNHMKSQKKESRIVPSLGTFTGTVLWDAYWLIFFRNWESSQSHDSSVGIALGYGLDDRGSRDRFPAGTGKFSLHHRVQNGSGAHPTSYPVGTRGLSLEVKRPGREVDHSSPSGAEVKECVKLYLHSPLRLHGVVLS
jgi:hypothetical protein